TSGFSMGILWNRCSPSLCRRRWRWHHLAAGLARCARAGQARRLNGKPGSVLLVTVLFVRRFFVIGFLIRRFFVVGFFVVSLFLFWFLVRRLLLLEFLVVGFFVVGFLVLGLLVVGLLLFLRLLGSVDSQVDVGLGQQR